MFVGGDAHIAPAEPSVFPETQCESVGAQRDDVGIVPYAILQDSAFSVRLRVFAGIRNFAGFHNFATIRKGRRSAAFVLKGRHYGKYNSKRSGA